MAPDRLQRLKNAEKAIDELYDWIQQSWRDSRREQVQEAVDAVELIVLFSRRAANTAYVANAVSRVVRDNEAYVSAFDRIRGAVTTCDACLRAIAEASRDLLPGLLQELTDAAEDLRRGLVEALDAFTTAVNTRTEASPDLATVGNQAIQLAEEVRAKLRSKELLVRAGQAAQDAELARDRAREAAGETGAESLGVNYERYADRETSRADLLRTIVAGLLISITVGVVVVNILAGPVSFTTELVRLSATIPVAVLAFYLAGESSRHRAHAKWAQEISLAMKTMPAYAEPLGADGLELWRALGMKAFSPMAGKIDPLDDAGLIDTVVAFLKKLLHLGGEATERQSQ